MKAFLLIAVLYFFSGNLSAQENPYQQVDSLIGAYPQKVNNKDDLRKVCSFIFQNIQADSLRFRAIVVWIANNIDYDVKSWQTENPQAGQLDYVLQKQKAICAGYASLLKYMCDLFQIECEVVTGRARSFDRDIYLQQSRLTVNHAWNMVKINGQWRLIDPTWVAGHVSGEIEDPKTKFVKEFNEAYYFTPPERFILNHFPKQSRHQLLSPFAKEDEFRTSPLYLTAFLKKDVLVSSPKEALIKATVGDTIRFRFRSNALTSEMMAWSPKLDKARYSGETTLLGDVVEFRYPVSASGFYNLFIGQMLGLRGEALLAYKLQVDPKRISP